jgi:Protein of unknown function (DUF2934)
VAKKPASVLKPPAAKPATGFPAVATPEVMKGEPAARKAQPEDIRLRAYLKWMAAGRPAGDGVKFWLEAEQELLRGK